MFIKDIIYYLVPPEQQGAKIAPSLTPKKRGIGTVNGVSNGSNGVSKPFPFHTEAEPENPTIVPKQLLEKFHFTFLIRDPHHSIPSYYRCTIPPLEEMTGFHDFYPNEAGYDEVRRVFDYLRKVGLVGPKFAESTNGHTNGYANGYTNGEVNGHVNGNDKEVEICVIDADDLLDDPEGIIKSYCQSIGLEYDRGMLNWDNEEDQESAKAAFAKWKGFHEDVLDSTDLKPRAHVSD